MAIYTSSSGQCESRYLNVRKIRRRAMIKTRRSKKG
nr:MAG TPA: hypothetical protein [Caudoviricetes sp.]